MYKNMFCNVSYCNMTQFYLIYLLSYTSSIRTHHIIHSLTVISTIQHHQPPPYPPPPLPIFPVPPSSPLPPSSSPSSTSPSWFPINNSTRRCKNLMFCFAKMFYLLDTPHCHICIMLLEKAPALHLATLHQRELTRKPYTKAKLNQQF